jgi:hypothetical protein
MALSHVISRCIAKWQSEGVVLDPPIAEDEVRGVWASCKREPSSDVLQMYAAVGGFHDYTFDEEFFWSLWPWEWLKERNQESPRDGIMFCDHSIEIVTWELRYETSKHSSVWSSHGNQTAPTLERFLEQYLDDPWQLM